MNPYDQFEATTAVANPYDDFSNPYDDIEEEGDSFQVAKRTPYDDSTLVGTSKAAGMELVAAIDRGVISLADFLYNPVRVGAELLNDEEYPTLRQALAGTEFNVEGGYMEGGLARDAVQAFGEVAIPGAAGFKSVVRAPGAASSVLADLLGFGTSTADDYARMAEITARNLKGHDSLVMGQSFLTTDDDIANAAYQSAKRQIIEKNRTFADEYDSQIARVMDENKSRLKAAEKAGIDPSTVELITEEGMPEGITKFSLREVQDDLNKLYDLSPKETLRVLGKRGGLKFDKDEVIRFTEADKQFGQQARTHGAETSFSDWLITPMSDVLRKRVGPQVGGVWERSMETAARATSRMVDDIGKPISRVAKFVDETPRLKALLLDLHIGDAQKKIVEARRLIKNGLGESHVQAFDRFMLATGKHNGEARRILYKPNSGFDQPFYLHTQVNSQGVKRGNQGRGWAGKLGSPANRKMTETMERSRKPAREMDPEELSTYQNPILSHLRYMNDQEQLMQVARNFKLRPALGKNSKSGDVFTQLSTKLQRDGIDPARAEEARRIMNDSYMGSTMAPHPAVRAIMDLAYGGTLAQFKSAMLNLHDVFVSMVNIGVRPTLKALMQTTKGQFGRTLEQMGIGSQQSMGEFVRAFDAGLDQSGAWGKVSEKTHEFVQGAFKWSLFAAMDRIGKGIVVRAALNKARSAAKKGRLSEEWGEVLRKDELMSIRRFMVSGAPFEKMPKDVAELVEQAVFSKLGQQQLTSIAGRPLAYAQHPGARPLYALSGFAIKQLALLRKEVVHEISKGNYAKGGSYLAKYVTFAGLGYGLLDETRSAILKDEEFDLRDVPWGVVDQLAAAITMNRLGDTYSLQQFADDPMEYLLTSVIPPMGLTGAAAQDAADLILKGEYNAELVKKFPVIGDFYKYYWSDKKEKPSKAEGYMEFIDNWGEGK
jgi:hypothetical protein